MKSRQLRRFLDRFEKALLAQGPLTADSAEARWLAWARTYANEINPFTSGSIKQIIRPDDVLGTNPP